MSAHAHVCIFRAVYIMNGYNLNGKMKQDQNSDSKTFEKAKSNFYCRFYSLQYRVKSLVKSRVFRIRKNIYRYWEEASSGRDFVIILTVVVLYQVNLIPSVYPHPSFSPQACMVLSAIFHTFNSHSREASEFCLMLDLGGISCSIPASYISGKNITHCFLSPVQNRPPYG